MQNGLFFKPSLKGFGVKLINVGDLYAHIPIDSDTLELFGATDRECESFRVEDGDLFFTRSSIVPAGIAHCNIYCSSEREPVVFDSHVIRVRPDRQKVVPAYLFRFFTGSVARRYLVSHAKTATMTTIDQGVLGNCPVLLPPTKAEQEAIAEALSDADALIDSLGQLIAKKRQLKQAAIQELLTGKKRLPGFSKDWERRRIADLAVLSRSGVNPGSTPNVSYSHFSLPAFDAGAIPVVEHGSLIGSNKFVVPPNAVLLSKLNPRIPRVWAPSQIPPNAVCSTEFLVLVPREGTDRDFLKATCRSPTVSYQMELHAIGTTGSHQRINPSQALAIEVRVPGDKAEQTAIAAVLSDMDEEIATLEAAVAKAGQVKQGMMQELLTGRIRLV